MINMRKSNLIILGIILLSFVIGFYFYPQMPEKMASHWNTQGQVDKYLSKFWGLFLMPFVLIGIFLLFLLIPKIDPLKANIEKFRKYFDGFIVVIILFLFYIYILAILWNLGQRFNMVYLLIPALAILFYSIGILVEKAKRNWFIGIRTPWTLSNDKVWQKTHQIGGKLFKIAGLIALFGFFFPRYAIFFMIIPMILFAVYLVIYSYFAYQKAVKKF